MGSKDDTKSAPEVFNVPVRDDPQPEREQKTSSGTRTSGVKSNGVPAGRLAGFALPVLTVVAGAAMWMVSPLLAVGVLGGAVTAGGAYAAHKALRKRPGSTTRQASSGPRIMGATTGTRGRVRRGLFGGRSTSGHRSAGLGLGGGGRSGRSRGGLLGRARRAATGRAPSSGRSAANGAKAPSRGRALAGRLFGRGRGGSGTTGGRSRGRGSNGSTGTGGASRGRGRGLLPFGRGKRGSSGTGGASGSSPGRTKGKSKGLGLLTGSTGSGGKRGRGLLGTGGTSTGSTTTGRKKPRKRRDVVNDDRSGWSRGRDKNKGRDRGRGSSGGDKPSDGGGKVVKTTKDKAEDFSMAPRRRSGMKSEPLVDDGGFYSPGKGRTKAVPAGPLRVDDAGFPSPTVRKAEPAKPAPAKPAPKVEEFDDCGFPIATVTPINTQAGGGKPGNNGRKTKVSAPTSGEVRSGYAQMIDNSTAESRARTLNQVAETARRDAQALQEKANERRAEAAGLDDKPGMGEAAEKFRREAADLEEDSRNRLGMAAAYEEAAENEAKAIA